MLCEVVFLCNVELEELNSITFSNDAQMRPQVNIARYNRPDLLAATDELKWRLLKVLGAQPTRGPHFDPRVDEARWRKAFSDQGDSGEGGRRRRPRSRQPPHAGDGQGRQRPKTGLGG